MRDNDNEWVPKTRLGKMVVNGEIKTMDDALKTLLPIREPEVVDMLLPELQSEVIDISLVRRTTDSGRKSKFTATVIVGNKNGFVGVGTGKDVNVRPAIEKATRNAKLNIIKARMGCGSWECMCGGHHSIPYTTEGKWGSVKVKLFPAPKGTGLVISDTGKKVLEMAGIKDVWSKTWGDTRTVYNFAFAVWDALRNLKKTRIPDHVIIHAENVPVETKQEEEGVKE